MAAVDGFLKANKAVAVVVSDESYGGTDPSDARKMQTILSFSLLQGFRAPPQQFMMVVDASREIGPAREVRK
jgi:hypothetical protein